MTPPRFETLTLRTAFLLYKRVLSPLAHVVSPSQCLYLPTCSEYAYVALSRFGVVRGSWLALKRLGRCHPFAKGGFDPVPEPAGGPERSTAGDGATESRSSALVDHDGAVIHKREG